MSTDLSEFNIVTAERFETGNALQAAAYLVSHKGTIYGFADGNAVTADVDAVMTPENKVLFVSPSAKARGFDFAG